MSTSTPSQRTNPATSQGTRASGHRLSPIIIDDESSGDEKRSRRESSSSSSDSEDSLPSALELISTNNTQHTRRRERGSIADASSSTTPSRSALTRVDSNERRPRLLANDASASTSRPLKTEPKTSQSSDDHSAVSQRQQIARPKAEPTTTPSSSHPPARSSQPPTSLVTSEPRRSATSPTPATNVHRGSPFRRPLTATALSSRVKDEQSLSLGIGTSASASAAAMDEDRLARIREWSRQASFAPPSSSRGQPGAAASSSSRQEQVIAPPPPHQPHHHAAFAFAPPPPYAAASGASGSAALGQNASSSSSSRQILPPNPSLGYPGAYPSSGFDAYMSSYIAANSHQTPLQMPGGYEAAHLLNGPLAADFAAAQQPGAASGSSYPRPPPGVSAAGSAFDVLHGLGNGTIEANPDAMKDIVINDADAVSDMANLKPCPPSALAYLSKAGLTTRLKPHQSTALRFLIQSEHRTPPAKDGDQKCLFKRLDGVSGRTLYRNIAERDKNLYEEALLPRGCILADAMGLGKTLSVLALIMSPPDGKGFIDGDGGGDGVDAGDDDVLMRDVARSDNDDEDRKPRLGPKGKQRGIKLPARSNDDDERRPRPAAKEKKRGIKLPDGSDDEREPRLGDKGKKRAIKLPNRDSDDDSDDDIFRVKSSSKKVKKGPCGAASKGKGKKPVIVSDSDSDSDDGPSRRRQAKSNANGREDPHDTLNTTLVICPLSVLSNWVEQVKDHCPSLRVGVLYGEEGKKLRAEKSWGHLDLVVTTYDTVKFAYKSIDLLNLHEHREAGFQARRAEIKDELEEQRELQRANVRHGSSSSRASMAAVYEQAIESKLKELAQHDEEVARERMVTPKLGGTDWKKKRACLARLAKLQDGQGRAQGMRKGQGKGKSKASHESDSDSEFGKDLDDESDDDDISSFGRSSDASKAEFFDPMKFGNFNEDDLLYIWSNMRRKEGQTRMFEQEWLRVVLDEAHTVRNRATQSYSAIQALKCERRVAVTGTPIVNGSSDLGSLASWIGIYPFSHHPKVWAERIDNPIKRGRDGEGSQAMMLLKSITKDLVCLRTKDMKIDGRPLVDLPSIEHLRYDIRLKPDDERFYARAEEALKATLMKWLERGEELGAQRLVCMLVFLCRMRQLACDRRLVPATLIEDIEAAALEEGDDTTKTPSQLQAILAAMVTNADDCPICMEPLPGASSVPVITPCSHCFHKDCLASSLAASRKCPMDRRALDMSKVLELAENEGEEVTDSGLGDSAKIDALVEIINNVKAAHPTDKVLVFSNFVGFLRLVSARLELEEIEHATFYGSHSRTQRDETLRQFRRPLREPTAAEAAAAAAARTASLEQQRLREELRSAVVPGNANDDLLAALDSEDFAILSRPSAATANASSSSSSSRPRIAARNPPPRVLLLSIQAGGVGLNLTEANHVILTDPWWQGAIEAQAIDRAHRIGQKKPVKVYKLVSNRTVEDRVVQVAQEKMELASEVLGGLQYKGTQLFKGKASTRSRLKDIAKLFGLNMSSGSGGRVPGPISRRR